MSSIREATLADAPTVLALNQALDRETRIMLLERVVDSEADSPIGATAGR
jgi:hypothetical protein